MSYSAWTLVGERRPDAAFRLFCFPYAGAGASVFREWHRHIPGNIEVIGVQLPGRENRFHEPRHTRLADLIAPLKQMLSQLADKPFFFFGHSLGALVAFELARALQQDGLPLPFHLVASGMCAPHLRSRDEQLHLMPDDELLEKIAEYNGTPRALLQDRELMRFFLPQLRADFAICETYEYVSGTRLNCPVTALGGQHDPNVSADELLAWSVHTAAPFRQQLFDGDHFFIHPCQQAVLGLLGPIAAGFLETPLADRSCMASGTRPQ
jgi:surfactin synthase thioesterase subunit